MSKKVYALIFICLSLGLLLAACERPASVSPLSIATGEIPFPVSTTSSIMKDILAATQTAMATAGTVSTGDLLDLTATSTPVYTYITATPQDEIATAETTATPTTEVATTAMPTTTVTPYPTATPGIPNQYVIQSGEFPYCIARRFNVDPAALLNANGLNNNSWVAVGTVLTIPQGSIWPNADGSRALIAHPATYTVNYGDTLGSIACEFGDVDPNTILAANGLSSGTILTQGQVLQIP